MAIWKLMERYCRHCAPIVVFFPALVFGVIGNIQLSENCPIWLRDERVSHLEERILLMWMICFFANYNSYLTTLLVMVPVLTPLYTVMILRLFQQTHG